MATDISPDVFADVSQTPRVTALPGAEVPSAVRSQLRRGLLKLLGLPETNYLPVPSPIILTRNVLESISQGSYFVCERPVGLRCFVLALQHETFLVDSHFQIRKVDLHFPLREDRVSDSKTKPTASKEGAKDSTVDASGSDSKIESVCVTHNWTLMDCEIAYDQRKTKTGDRTDCSALSDSAKDRADADLGLVISDVLVVNGSPVMKLPLLDRLKIIQNDIIAPRKQYFANHKNSESLRVYVKSFYPTSKAKHFINKVIPRLAIPSTGVLLLHGGSAYQLGIGGGSMFSWVPASNLACNFQLGVEWRGRPPCPGFKLLIHHDRTTMMHDWLTLSAEHYAKLSKDRSAAKRVVECVYDADWFTFIPSTDKTSWTQGSPEVSDPEKGQGWRKGGWKLVRIRHDLHGASDVSLLSAIQNALQEKITLAELARSFAGMLPVESDAKSARAPAAIGGALSRGGPISGLGATAVGVLGDGPHGEPVVPRAVGTGKRKRPGESTQGVGVCYDFQNKGFCRRGNKCQFAHCACDSFCSCTKENNTFGFRPRSRVSDTSDITEVSPSLQDAEWTPGSNINVAGDSHFPVVGSLDNARDTTREEVGESMERQVAGGGQSTLLSQQRGQSLSPLNERLATRPTEIRGISGGAETDVTSEAKKSPKRKGDKTLSGSRADKPFKGSKGERQGSATQEGVFYMSGEHGGPLTELDGGQDGGGSAASATVPLSHQPTLKTSGSASRVGESDTRSGGRVSTSTSAVAGTDGGSAGSALGPTIGKSAGRRPLPPTVRRPSTFYWGASAWREHAMQWDGEALAVGSIGDRRSREQEELSSVGLVARPPPCPLPPQSSSSSSGSGVPSAPSAYAASTSSLSAFKSLGSNRSAPTSVAATFLFSLAGDMPPSLLCRGHCWGSNASAMPPFRSCVESYQKWS